MRTSLLALAVAAAAAAALPAHDAHAARPSQIDAARAATVDLQHRLARGQTRVLTLTASQTVEAVEGPQVPLTVLNLDVGVNYEVQSVTDATTAQVSASFVPNVLGVTEGGRNADMSPVLNSLRGTRLSFQLTNRGTLSDRTGAITRDPTRADAGSLVLDCLAMSWVQFPQEPVSIGESWLQSTSMALGEGAPTLNASVSVRYTFAGYVLHGGREKLLLDAVYTTVIAGSSQSTGGTTTLIDGRGRGEGFVIFDATEGAIAEVEVQNGVVITYTDSTGARATETVRQQWRLSDGSAGLAALEGSGAVTPP